MSSQKVQPQRSVRTAGKVLLSAILFLYWRGGVEFDYIKNPINLIYESSSVERIEQVVIEFRRGGKLRTWAGSLMGVGCNAL